MATRAAQSDAIDVHDPRLPGSSLVDAIFNRRLMSWSDRGGASMTIGACWAQHCTTYLEESSGAALPIPGEGTFRLSGFIRLDDNPQVEREANLNQLENPDFLLFGEADDGALVVQAADAKFAADRIKPSQVSVGVVEALLEVPKTGATREALRAALPGGDLDRIEIVPGVFLSPDSGFTDLLLERARQRDAADADDEIIARVPADPGKLFGGTLPAQLIPTLARADRLPVSPQRNLLAAVYYLRLASACLYFWDEQTRPLLSLRPQSEPVEMGLLAAEVSRRLARAHSAFSALVSWHRDLHEVMAARKTVTDAVSLPIGINEIRERLSDGRGAPDPAAVRSLRKALELEFRALLHEQVGTIYPDDPRSLSAIVKQVRAASRALRPELLRRMDALAGP